MLIANLIIAFVIFSVIALIAEKPWIILIILLVLGVLAGLGIWFMTWVLAL